MATSSFSEARLIVVLQRDRLAQRAPLDLIRYTDLLLSENGV